MIDGIQKQLRNILFFEATEASVLVDKKNIGGSMVSLFQIVQKLDKEKYRPVVVLCHDYDVLDEFRRNGCKVIVLKEQKNMTHSERILPQHLTWFLRCIPGKQFLKEILRVLRKRSLVKKLQSIIKQEKIDIVHCNNRIEGIVEGVIASLLAHKPCICHNRQYSRNTSWLFKWLGNKVEKHIAISSSIKENLVNEGFNANKISLIHNWINTDNNPPLQNMPIDFKNERTFNIVSVGRIVPWKGQHLLIKAAQELKRRRLNFRVHIYGHYEQENEYFNLLKKMVEENDLQAYVLFNGHKTYKEIYSQEFHLAVHTSTSPEPFGRVIIEAMYNNIPVIASGLGGTLDIIQDGKNGFLFDPTKPDELVEKIMLTISDNELRLRVAKMGYRTVLAKFSDKGNMETLTSIYEELLSH